MIYMTTDTTTYHTGPGNAAPMATRKAIDSWDWADIPHGNQKYRHYVKHNGRRVHRRRDRQEIRQGLFD